ncbi:MAG: tetratricopeptide repeat protein [Algicola sp.]|nr:tetratricopeptide repeat protein [Algicola sp.]
MNVLNLNHRKAQKLHKQAEALSDAGQDEQAIELYLQAIELNPEKSESYYNIGLIHKYQNRWQQSLDFNQKAYALAPDDEASRWNLAIAATALRKWDIARSAWKDNGIKLTGEAGPIEDNFGMTPLRLNPNENAEVVWAHRIDPVRARIQSIPYAESGFKFGDIVLHDGASVGSREVDGRQYQVFNVLELFESSNYQTMIVNVMITKEQDLETLEALFSSTKHDWEDWTTNTTSLCKQCSEGTPHDHHDQHLQDTWQPKRTLGVAVYDAQDIMPIFQQWQQMCVGTMLCLTN